MIALLTTRRAPAQAKTTRRYRIDSPVSSSEAYPESMYLRRWAARQASRYQDLLQTIAAAPTADGRG